MANGFDRLERLFSARRKPSPVACEATATSSLPQQLEQTFPAPSFIRPTAARMAAREEVGVRQLSVRYSSAGSLLPQRMASQSSQSSPSPRKAACSKPLKTRIPSLIAYEQDSLMSNLSEIINASTPDPSLLLRTKPFNSNPPRTITEHPPSPITPTTSSEHVTAFPRVDTPPSLESEDRASDAKISISDQTVFSRSNAPPTPEPSPQLRPVPDSGVENSEHVDRLARPGNEGVIDEASASFTLNTMAQDAGNSALPSHPSGGHHEEFQNPENHPWDLQGLQAQHSASHRLFQDRFDNQWSPNPSPHTSLTGSTLCEPDFSDFLNLSDEDIAEEAPDSPVLPPRDDESLPSMDLSISSLEPPVTSLMTLSPPRASRPATAAAFEAARIARRYDFDLVYVVSLWPDVTSASSHPDSDLPNHDRPERPLVGRLLAAHGLHHVPSPLQISSVVHSKILSTEGWTEYRNRTCDADDLARGYACAFYKGSYARNRSMGSSASASNLHTSDQIERGIVFAAYRKPRNEPDVLGPALSAEDLGNLYREAEALVEMLMDFHAASRIRHPETSKPVSEEIGPLPQGLSESS